MTVAFEVFGRPAPQGSKTLMRGRMVESSKYLPAWRKAVAEAALAQQAETGWFCEGPVHVLIYFTVEKPKTVKRKHPTVPPDIDKLARSVLDSCSGVFYNDDAQVVKLIVSKRYGENPGAAIEIAPYND